MWERSKSATGSDPLLAGAVLSLALASCGEGALAHRAERPRPKSVVLVCWDTVRADHLGCYGYDAHPTTPNLDRLAERSVLFESASSAAGWTKPSVPSFLTGTYPSQHGVYEGSARLEMGEVTDTLPAGSTTLAEVLQGAGYQTAAFVRNAQLRRGNGFEQGFELYADEAGDAREIRWQALDWLDGRDEDRPFFLYLHFLDAHWPYPVPDEYAGRFTDADLERFRGRESKAYRDAVNDGREPWTDEDRATLEALYDGSLRYLDDELGRLLDGLRLRSLAEDTIVCVVSDHGEEFGEHGRLGHGHGLWESLLRVPWVLHVPGLAPRRVAEDVGLVDLFPTLLGAAGHPSPLATAGVDRLAPGAPRRPVFAEHKAPDRYLQSLRRGQHKLVRSFTPPPRAVSSERSLDLGGRWEASFEPDAEGVWRLVELDEEEGDSDDPVELKGPLQVVEDEHLVVAGVRVGRNLATAVAPTDDAEDDELVPGRMVKLRLADDGEGGLTALRVKIYARDTPVEHEVRGPLTGGDPGATPATLRVGAFALVLDEESDVDSDAWAGPAAMRRSEVLACLLGGGGVGDAGFEVSSSGWRVSGWDEHEDAAATAALALEPELDALAHDLAESRVFDDADRKVLTPDALEELRAIGYVE